jgi:hypothetical protein
MAAMMQPAPAATKKTAPPIEELAANALAVGGAVGGRSRGGIRSGLRVDMGGGSLGLFCPSACCPISASSNHGDRGGRSSGSAAGWTVRAGPATMGESPSRGEVTPLVLLKSGAAHGPHSVG